VSKLDIVRNAAGQVVDLVHPEVSLSAETRTFVHPELSGFDESTGIIEASAVVYDVTDTYNTRFLPGSLTEDLKRDITSGVVPLVWSHNHGRRVGKIIDYKDSPEKLTIVAQLDNPEELAADRGHWVRKAWKGLKSGVLDEVSVAVERITARTAADGATEFVRARMIHLGIVLEGAVPGAVVLGVRTAPKTPPMSPTLIAAGAAAAGPGSFSPPAPQVAWFARMDAAYQAAGLDPVRAPDPVDEAMAEADAALALLDGLASRDLHHQAAMLDAVAQVERGGWASSK
jgi:hypothetical protein